MVFFFRGLEISTDPECVGFADDASIYAFLGIFGFANVLDFFVEDIKALLVVARKLKKSGLTVDLDQHVFQVIVVPHQIEFHLSHLWPILVLPTDVALRQCSVKDLSSSGFDVDLIYSKDVVNIVDGVGLLSFCDHIAEVKSRLQLPSVRNDGEPKSIGPQLELSVCLFLACVSLDERGKQDVVSFCLLQLLLLLFSHINDRKDLFIHLACLELVLYRLEDILKGQPNICQSLWISCVPCDLAGQVPEK